MRDKENRWVRVSKCNVTTLCQEMRLYIRQCFHHMVIVDLSYSESIEKEPLLIYFSANWLVA